MKHIFLDTNIFLHFRPFEQIKWEEITGSIDYKIIITPTVISELDKHKYNTNKKLAKRAKKALSKLENLIEGEQAKLQLLSSRPKEATFGTYGFSQADQDDCLLASLIDYKEENSSADIVLVTYDSGPRFKAKTLGIQSMKMPSDFLLPEEQDETEKHIKALQQENLELKNRLPKLSFSFENNQLRMKHEVKPIGHDIKPSGFTKTEFIEKALQHIKTKHTPIVKSEKTAGNGQLGGFLAMSQMIKKVSDEQIDSYNRALVSYFHEYEKFLAKEYDYVNYLQSTIVLKFYLYNTGTAPAEDIDVYITFKDEFDLFNDRTLPKPPKEPQPPRKPKSWLDMYGVNGEEAISSYKSVDNRLSYEYFPTIEKTASYSVNYRYSALKHNQVKRLDSLYVHFESVERMKNFSIEYSLVIANHPKTIDGKLNVVVDKRLYADNI